MKEILKYLRQLHSYTQEDVAQKIGISRQSYIKYESGSVAPSDKIVAKLAMLYGVEKEFIYKNKVPDISSPVKKDVLYHIPERFGERKVASPDALSFPELPSSPTPYSDQVYDVYFDGNTLRLTNNDGSHFVEGQRFKLVPVDSVDKAERRKRAFETLLSFRGTIKLPENFDYKEELYKALEEKYGPFN
ncbi:MAG: helix-turn-helix transcriptional regulator [Treponema sp.]|nr:helix-turn-helix transcriptional regulator [Treponema sp.]